MSVSNAVVISEYYLDELDSRKASINHFLEEIEECEQLLKEIPRFNSFSHLAERTERHLKQLYIAKQHFLADKERLDELESKLYEKDAPVENSKVTPAIDEELEQIWHEELTLDTSFLQVRTCCRKFLFGVVVSPNRKDQQSENDKEYKYLVPQRQTQEAYLI